MPDLASFPGTGVLTTLRRDGTPVGLPIWWVPHRDSVAMATMASSWKVRRLANDPRCSFTVHDGERYHELRFRTIVGNARLLEGDERQEALRALDRRFPPQLGGPSLIPDPGAPFVAVITIDPTDVYQR